MASDTIYDVLKAYYDGIAPSQGLATRLDDAGSGVTYVGKALAGSISSNPVWQIQRLTELNGDITVEWADGDISFDNTWDDRASLSYS